MGQEDDQRGMGKVIDLLRAVSIILLVLNVYVFCYEWFLQKGIVNKIVSQVIFNLSKTGLFEQELNTKLGSLLLLGFSCLGVRGTKSESASWKQIYIAAGVGILLFFFNDIASLLGFTTRNQVFIYAGTMGAGYTAIFAAAIWISRLINVNLMEDTFNTENESFMQETQLMENEYSVNLPTRFWYDKKQWDGWINVVNPFRAVLVLGTPGSGKSYAIINQFIKTQIEKGFAMYIYDFKYPDLSTIAYNHLLNHTEGYKVKPVFYVINFDDPSHSHRCNPINPAFMTDIADAYEASYTIMLNLNKTWIQKQGDFFVESPIILLAAIIWFLKIYENGKYCTFPHTIEFLNKSYEQIFPILTSYPELENYLSPFMDAWESQAQDQLQVRP